MTEVTVTFDEHRHRWEGRVDGELAGKSYMRRREGLVIFWHTEVDDRFEGLGVGSAIARAALDAIAAEGGTKVRPDCPFIRSWIERHPDYTYLLEDGSAHRDDG
jgi:predicted GNAT family acetyltransferase